MSGLVETSWYKSLVALESTKAHAQRIKEPMTSFVKGRIKKLGRGDSSASAPQLVLDRDRESLGDPEERGAAAGTPSEDYGDLRLRSGSSASPSLGAHRKQEVHTSTVHGTNGDALWDDGEKAIYEQQLEQLQEQLMAVMIEKDQLGKFCSARVTQN